MMSKFRLRNVLPILLLLTLVSTASFQTSASESTGIYGVIKDGLYTNSIFRFQIQFPNNWTVLENEEVKELTKIGLKIAQLDEKEIERNKKYRVSLLSLMKKVPGEPGNATVALSAMKQPASSVSPLVVANLSREGMSESPVIKFNSDTSLMDIGGRKFATFDYTLTVGDRKSKGKCLVTMVRDYSITMFISNESAGDDRLVSSIVNSFKFY